MSASNWDVCPRCKLRHEKEADRLRGLANAAYGTVPSYEWVALNEKAKKAGDRFTDTHFREDYEIFGAEDGLVSVRYSGECEACGLSASFKHEVPIAGIDTPSPNLSLSGA